MLCCFRKREEVWDFLQSLRLCLLCRSSCLLVPNFCFMIHLICHVIVWFFFLILSDSKIPRMYGAIGNNIVVPLNHKLDKASVLKWKHNDTIIFEQRKNKSPNPIYVKGKKHDINPDGSLKLTNLDANDSGNYIPKVYSQDGALESNMKITRLCVLGRWHQIRVILVLWIYNRSFCITIYTLSGAEIKGCSHLKTCHCVTLSAECFYKSWYSLIMYFATH